MKISKEDLAAFRVSTDTVPIQGFLVDEAEDYLMLKDRGGTLRIKREDVISIDDWKAHDSRFDGRPVRVHVRDGSEILDIQPMRVKTGLRPPALPVENRDVKGIRELEELSLSHARRIGINDFDLNSSCTAGVSMCTQIKCFGSGIARTCYPVSVPCDSRCD